MRSVVLPRPAVIIPGLNSRTFPGQDSALAVAVATPTSIPWLKHPHQTPAGALEVFLLLLGPTW